MEQEFSSPLLENAVSALSRLPGIGRRSALRLALHLLRREESESEFIGQSIINLRRGIRYCSMCHNISETEICPICSSDRRDASQICVVESVKDVMIIENTRQYFGLYHVLGGLISPIDGIGPNSLEIASLITRAADPSTKEIILATGATVEADTTNFYIYRLLARSAPHVAITQIARGVAVGNELEFTDEATLARSLMARTPFTL